MQVKMQWNIGQKWVTKMHFYINLSILLALKVVTKAIRPI